MKNGLWSSQFEMDGCNGKAFEFCMWKHQRMCSNCQNLQSYEGSVILGSGQGTFWGWDASIRPIPSEVGDLIDGFPWSDHLQSFFKTKFNTITLNENYTQVTKTRQGGCRQNWLFSLHICPSYCAVSTERESSLQHNHELCTKTLGLLTTKWLRWAVIMENIEYRRRRRRNFWVFFF